MKPALKLYLAVAVTAVVVAAGIWFARRELGGTKPPSETVAAPPAEVPNIWDRIQSPLVSPEDKKKAMEQIQKKVEEEPKPPGAMKSGTSPEKVQELTKMLQSSTALGTRLKQPFPKPEEFDRVQTEIDMAIRMMFNSIGRPLPDARSKAPAPPAKDYAQTVKDYSQFRQDYEKNYALLDVMDKQQPAVAAEAKKYLYFKWSILRLQDAFYTGGRVQSPGR